MVCITTVSGQEDLMIVTDGGIIIRLQVEDISQNGRATQGVRLMKLGDNQAVSTVAKVIDKTEDEVRLKRHNKQKMRVLKLQKAQMNK